jgi:hypothetical protein
MPFRRRKGGALFGESGGGVLKGRDQIRRIFACPRAEAQAHDKSLGPATKVKNFHIEHWRLG